MGIERTAVSVHCFFSNYFLVSRFYCITNLTYPSKRGAICGYIHREDQFQRFEVAQTHSLTREGLTRLRNQIATGVG
jgi:hypothetical protein